MINQIPERKGGRWDTHSFYQTIGHLHFTVIDSNNDMIDLLLVECKSGKWFIEDEMGVIKDNRVFQPQSKEFQEPTFYDDVDAVEKAACEVAAENSKVHFEDIFPYFCEN